MQSATFQRIPHLSTDVYFKSKARVASWKHCLSNRRFWAKSEKGRERHINRCVLRTRRFVWQNSNAKLTILQFSEKRQFKLCTKSVYRNLFICAHFRVIAISNYIPLKSFSSAVPANGYFKGVGPMKINSLAPWHWASTYSLKPVFLLIRISYKHKRKYREFYNPWTLLARQRRAIYFKCSCYLSFTLVLLLLSCRGKETGPMLGEA